MKALKEREHKVIYKDGDKVVKVFDETFSKADVLNEALNKIGRASCRERV